MRAWLAQAWFELFQRRSLRAFRSPCCSAEVFRRNDANNTFEEIAIVDWKHRPSRHGGMLVCCQCYTSVGTWFPVNQRDNGEAFRASGDALCTLCKRLYRHHPLSHEQLGYDDKPFLNQLCDGRLVKL